MTDEDFNTLTEIAKFLMPVTDGITESSEVKGNVEFRYYGTKKPSYSNDLTTLITAHNLCKESNTEHTNDCKLEETLSELIKYNSLLEKRYNMAKITYSNPKSPFDADAKEIQSVNGICDFVTWFLRIFIH